MHKENGLAERGWRTLVTMKDSILIDSGLPNGFWTKAIKTANYLYNRLPTKSKSHGETIPKECWTARHQNLEHICIFESLAFCNIPDNKRSKSNYQKVWKGILIGYSPNMSKYFRIWAPQTRQGIIASEPYIDKSEQGAKLLSEWPLEASTALKKKAPAGEPRPRGRPRKIAAKASTALAKATDLTKIDDPTIPELASIKNQTETAMSIIEYSSKIYEPTSYKEATNDPVHGRRWREAIEEELQNLENY